MFAINFLRHSIKKNKKKAKTEIKPINLTNHALYSGAIFKQHVKTSLMN